MLVLLLLLLLMHDLLMLIPGHLLIADPLGTTTTILLPIPFLICLMPPLVLVSKVTFILWALVLPLALEGFSSFFRLLYGSVEFSCIKEDTGARYLPMGKCF